MNWFIIIPVGIAVIALLYFIMRSNFKDEKKLEDQLNQDYPKPKEDKEDVEAEESAH
jgi:hypothetical protein